jgi:hypothetical protein
MTEADWLACTDPQRMLQFLGARRPTGLMRWLRRDRGKSQPSPQQARKLRLLACACCRRIDDLMVDERSREAVEVAELHAVGAASDAELEAAREQARAAYEALLARGNVPHLPLPYARPAEPTLAWVHAAGAALAAARGEVTEAMRAFEKAAMLIATDFDDLAWAREAACAAAQVALIREIFGNPCCDAIADPAWLRWHDGTVPRIALGIYKECRFADMPILHDALLDAGCDDETVLDHCRTTDGHVRGCWVIDALLEKP